MLIKAAALEWNVSSEQCVAFKNAVKHEASGRCLTYGQLCLKAAELPVPSEVTLKEKSQFNYIGQDLPRVDSDDKINGIAQFGIDVFVENMLYAAVARPSAYGANLISYDEEAALQINGPTSSQMAPSRNCCLCRYTRNGMGRKRSTECYLGCR